MINLKKILNFSQKLGLSAGKLLLNKQAQVKIVKQKDLVDIVTNADLEAEKLIIKAIQEQYPDHNIYSEEKGWLKKESDYTWYIDPLDGTKEYCRQIPSYNTSFCLFYKKNPIISVVNIPFANQLFSAQIDNGSFLNGERILVSNQSNLGKSIIYSHTPGYQKIPLKDFDNSFDRFRVLAKNCYRLRFSSDENGYLCYLALGSIEAYLNFVYPTKSIEDFIPGLFIAKMAGAKITDLKGKEFDFNQAYQLFIASNGHIHQDLIKLIS